MLIRVGGVVLLAAALLHADDDALFRRAHANGQQFDRACASMDRLLKAWLKQADPKTLLLPDLIGTRTKKLPNGEASRLYTPHNSGADLYPYLILTASLTAPDLYRGRLLHMLRNEVRYTTVQESIPANLEMTSGELGPPSLFGAGEYAKDGLIAVTEYLGRTPWFYRMTDMVADAMNRAPVKSRFGNLPAADAELNGDYLQALVRLETMTGDMRFANWARRIADAYIDEVLPGNHGVPSSNWDFEKHVGDGRLRLRDHGNEIVVGLVLQFALENYWGTPRAAKWRPSIARMLDRILASANPDGLLYNEVDSATLEPRTKGLSDNWGYVYGAMYTFFQSTGEAKYRESVRNVLRGVAKYRRYNWEPSGPELPLGSFDGYADSIESALYLVSREPVPEAFDWIDSEMKVMMDMQRPDGHIEDWYGEGNYNRTVILWALMKSQGVRPEHWTRGLRIGAVASGPALYLAVDGAGPTRVQFDFARHRRVLNFDRNYVRLNEFPEWFVVDENTLYRVRARRGGTPLVLLGSELIAGVSLEPGEWIIEPAGARPYARNTRPHIVTP